MSFYLNFLAADPGIRSRKPEKTVGIWAGCGSPVLGEKKIINLSEIIKIVPCTAYGNLNIGCQQGGFSIDDSNILLLVNKCFDNGLNSWESNTARREGEEGWRIG